jgi:YD repeat-containing protein
VSNFTYDKEGRQTKADYGNGLFVNYSYTATSPDWTVIEGPTIGRIERKFTADGKLGGWVTPDGEITFTYDAAGRLWKETQPNGQTTEYTYDAQGNRIGEVSGGSTKNYLVAPNLGNGLASTDLVTDGSGNVVSDYVYGGSQIIARLDANGDPLYYLTDSMGSVIGLVDVSGNIQSRIIYDGFGNVESGDNGSSTGGDLRFQGQWLESESGLY